MTKHFICEQTGNGFEDGTLVLAADSTAVVCMNIDTGGLLAVNDDPTILTTHFLMEDGLAGALGRVLVKESGSLFRTNDFLGSPAVGQFVRASTGGKLAGVAQAAWNATHQNLGIIVNVTGDTVEFVKP